jgi:hypothetical protein
MIENDPIVEYYKSPRVSNSLLKSVQNPRVLKLKKDNPELFDEDSVALRVGSAVDCLLTDPKAWDTKFKVLEVNKPYGFMGTFVSHLPKGITKESPKEDYMDAYWMSGYKMSADWVINKFWTSPDAVEYYNTAKQEDVTILAKDEYDSVKKAVELVMISPYAHSYFIRTKIHEELLHQVPIYFNLDSVECKGLLDGIKIDHQEKTIEPFDLKTIGKSVYDFPNNYLAFGYYTQAAFYTYALQTKESPVYNLLNEGYTLKDFIFIVTETKTSSFNPALIYTTSEAERNAGMHGGEYNGKRYKGIYELIEDYLWHVETDQWIYPREIYQNAGRVPLKVFS